jgi:hypothetical protein
VVLAALGAAAAACVSGADEVPEYNIKAAFLLNFTHFVEWQPSAFSDPAAPFAICILGNDPFGRVLDDIVQGELVNGRRLIVRRITQAPVPQTCQILFTEDGRHAENPGRGVLTVGEGDRFVHEGGMIAFVLENRRVRFEINQTAAEGAGLKLSSRLLMVAKSVVQ